MRLLLKRRLRPPKNARYLIFKVSHNAQQCVVLELRYQGRPGAPEGRMSVELYPNIQARACLDLSIMELGRGHHPRVPGIGFVCNSGPLISISELKSVEIFNQGAPKGFRARVSGIRLAAKPAGAQVSSPLGPLVDAYGQSTRHSWPGKRQDLELAGPEVVPRVLAAKAGKWRVEKDKGRFWLLKPDGGRFYSIGVTCVRPFSSGPAAGMEALHAWLPPKKGPLAKAWLDEVRSGVSFYTANLIRRYGKDWERRWALKSVARLQGWGFNTIANWSDPLAWTPRGMHYTANAQGWDEPKTEKGWGLYNGFPDVFSPAFERRCRAHARKVARPQDPLLIGYFILNEPPWQRESFHLAKLALETDRAPATKAALKAWLRRKHGNEGAAPSQDDLDQMRELMVDRYFSLACGALRREDPHHLMLGIRFYGVPPAFLLKAMRHMDVVSLNNYEPRPNPAIVETLHKATGKPLMFGEFHMGAFNRGMHSGLVAVKNEAERGAGYSHYMEQCAKLPYCVGAHWFQYVDQVLLGRFDGENYNIGLVDVTDTPYPDLCAAAQKTNPTLEAIHSGQLPARARAPRLASTGYAW